MSSNRNDDWLRDSHTFSKPVINSRKKVGNRYRKEASIIQNAISELKRQKRKHEKATLKSEQNLNENIDERDYLKKWLSR